MKAYIICSSPLNSEERMNHDIHMILLKLFFCTFCAGIYTYQMMTLRLSGAMAVLVHETVRVRICILLEMQLILKF